MKIHMLDSDEKYRAAKISLTAFHVRSDEPEKQLRLWMCGDTEDWGAFTDDDVLMARIVNNSLSMKLYGSCVKCGGVGAVSTLPEYRGNGAVRAIFDELLPHSYENGEVISALYPFSHSFYRKFGYETVCFANEYSFSPGVLNGYRFDGEAHQYSDEEPIEVYSELYESFTNGFNLALSRTEEMQKEHIGGNDIRDGKFTYLLSYGKRPAAYITFEDRSDSGKDVIRVRDYAWDGRDGFLAILGFLSRFSSDYSEIRIMLPRGIEMHSLLQSPRAYDVVCRPKFGFMVRAVNAQKLLGLLPDRRDIDISIAVSDDLIPQNNATWRITENDVKCTDQPPDVKMSIQSLSQIAVGAVSPEESMLRRDTEIISAKDMFCRLFPNRQLYISENF